MHWDGWKKDAQRRCREPLDVEPGLPEVCGGESDHTGYKPIVGLLLKRHLGQGDPAARDECEERYDSLLYYQAGNSGYTPGDSVESQDPGRSRERITYNTKAW